MRTPIGQIINRTREFQRAAHALLGKHESAKSRVVFLEASYGKLAKLSLRQDDLMRQALRCVDNDLYRAAHVMAWAGFMDFLEEKLGSDGFAKLREARPAWKFKTVEDLRESVVEYQLIEAAKEIGLIGKTEMKALLGLLNKRNECGHPSEFYPGYNDTLGYISELLTRMENLQAKSL